MKTLSYSYEPGQYYVQSFTRFRVEPKIFGRSQEIGRIRIILILNSHIALISEAIYTTCSLRVRYES